MNLNLYDKTKWYLVLHASVILVPCIFVVSSNEHLRGIHSCMSREDLCLGIILLCWPNIYKEFVGNGKNQKIRS